MKVSLKKAAMVLMIAISGLSFSDDDRTGFLSNMRELKEISDIMDVIQDSYVENANAHKNKEEKNKKTPQAAQKSTKVTKKSLMQGALKGMLESLDDPHSVYFTSEELRSFQEDIKGKIGKDGSTVTYVYKELGSWIPNIPGQPVNKIKYPNNPTDPTKPGQPTETLPYVPGYTPQDGNGNPLKPVDPKDPSKGYIVPDIPANPGQDTVINYVANSKPQDKDRKSVV